MSKIQKIVGREIFDSRGLPTIECELWLDNGIAVRAAAPSGTSKGSFEAAELRDKDARLLKMGVSKAIETLEDIIAPELIGKEPEVVEMDMALVELDDTEDKSKLGANTMIATSIAVAKAQSALSELEPFELIAHLSEQTTVAIPFPLLNVLNGGMHAHGALPIQEIMLVPVGSQTFRTSFESAVLVNQSLRSLLIKKGYGTAIGYEGGFAPALETIEQALDLLLEAIDNSKVKSQMVIALDVAANQLYDKKSKSYKWQNDTFDSADMIAMYETLAQKYPLYAIEDPLAESDYAGWKALTKALGKKIQIVGDDIFATNPDRIAMGVDEQLATTVVIKPNQIGTVTETLQAINYCKENGLQTIVSHRSGETEDTFIVDLAVGTSAGHLKAGGCMSGQSVAKYNQLLRVEDSLMLSMLD